MEKKVAPRAGAWIEAKEDILKVYANRKSLPVRERGLKRPLKVLLNDYQKVAPRAGAWIEGTSTIP